MTTAKRPRTLNEERESQARAMLAGGVNGDRILAELDLERAVSDELAAALRYLVRHPRARIDGALAALARWEGK